MRKKKEKTGECSVCGETVKLSLFEQHATPHFGRNGTLTEQPTRYIAYLVRPLVLSA